MPQIIINRSSEYSNALRKISILVNEQKMASISNEESVNLTIPTGEHKLKATIDWCSSNEIILNANEKDTFLFNLSGRNPLLALYYITFGRKEYLKLTPIK